MIGIEKLKYQIDEIQPAAAGTASEFRKAADGADVAARPAHRRSGSAEGIVDGCALVEGDRAAAQG